MSLLGLMEIHKQLNKEQDLITFFGIPKPPEAKPHSSKHQTEKNHHQNQTEEKPTPTPKPTATPKPTTAPKPTTPAKPTTPPKPTRQQNKINHQSFKLANFPKVVKENATVTLNAAATTDPEDGKNFLKFQWAQSAGIPIKKFLTKVDSPILRFVLPEVTPAGGSITMQLIVTDSKGESSVSKSPIFISLENVNKPPISSISKITPKNENSTVTLSASGSKDPDGEPLKFVWRQINPIPKVTIENNQSAVASFVAPNVQKDIKMQFSVNVLDGNKINGKANKTVTVLIKQVNLPPVADAGKNFVANESSIVTLNGNKTKDPDRLDKLKYLWTQVAGDLLIDIKNEKTIKPSFKVPFVKQNNSLYTFKLTVTDPKGLNSSDTVNMTVRKISNITVNPPNAQVVHNLIVKEGKNATLSAANSRSCQVKLLRPDTGCGRAQLCRACWQARRLRRPPRQCPPDAPSCALATPAKPASKAAAESRRQHRRPRSAARPADACPDPRRLPSPAPLTGMPRTARQFKPTWLYSQLRWMSGTS